MAWLSALFSGAGTAAGTTGAGMATTAATAPTASAAITAAAPAASANMAMAPLTMSNIGAQIGAGQMMGGAPVQGLASLAAGGKLGAAQSAITGGQVGQGLGMGGNMLGQMMQRSSAPPPQQFPGGERKQQGQFQPIRYGVNEQGFLYKY